MAKKIRIELINDYFIEVDEMNHTLKQRYTGEDKEGNKKEGCERTIGYFKTVQDCVERLIRLVALDETDKTVISLREYAECAEKAFKRIEEWRNNNEIIQTTKRYKQHGKVKNTEVKYYGQILRYGEI